MKLNELAKRVGKSAPYVMTLQKKFGLPASKDYPAGYEALVKKLIATLPFTWQVRIRCAASKDEAVDIYCESFGTKQLVWNRHALG